ncbi:endodeoxyribonuclease RusA [Variovorax sp. PAMC 28711]|nr:RusA family crossover junction endodeoxyribonuclease [Variovorax sp. PAMC 28711]AMM26528.1 endodeoxyribonuclease RusA [Variovorax sp. PAMC 28711]
MLTFHVPGQAVGKGRPRIGKVGNHARMFTPAKTVNYESLVALAAQQAMAGRALFDGPVELKMRIDCQIAASWSGKKQRDAAAGAIAPTTKPDIDNIVKAICDALNGVAWKDDVQVVDLIVRKRYAVIPGVAVQVVAMKPFEAVAA